MRFACRFNCACTPGGSHWAPPRAAHVPQHRQLRKVAGGFQKGPSPGDFAVGARRCLALSSIRTAHRQPGPRAGRIQPVILEILRSHDRRLPDAERPAANEKPCGPVLSRGKRIRRAAPILTAFWVWKVISARTPAKATYSRPLPHSPMTAGDRLFSAATFRCITDRATRRPDDRRDAGWRLGSELGAMQFTASDYYKYAVDYDGDGRRNLVKSTPDTIASAANFLKNLAGSAASHGLRKSG